METPVGADAKTYNDFYRKLRRTIKRSLTAWQKKKTPDTQSGLDKLVELLFLLPDLFHLCAALMLDKDIPLAKKGMLAAGVAYIFSPVDLIPDIVPVYGYLDDLVVLAAAVNAFLNTENQSFLDAAQKYWAGEGDLLLTVRHILRAAHEAATFLPKTLMKTLAKKFGASDRHSS